MKNLFAYFLLLTVFISCSKNNDDVYKDTVPGQNKTRTSFSCEELFKGIFWAEGPVASEIEFFSDFESIRDGWPTDLDSMIGLHHNLVYSLLVSTDTTFCNDFTEVVYNGTHEQIDSFLTERSQIVLATNNLITAAFTSDLNIDSLLNQIADTNVVASPGDPNYCLLGFANNVLSNIGIDSIFSVQELVDFSAIGDQLDENPDAAACVTIAGAFAGVYLVLAGYVEVALIASQYLYLYHTAAVYDKGGFWAGGGSSGSSQSDGGAGSSLGNCEDSNIGQGDDSFYNQQGGQLVMYRESIVDAIFNLRY